MTPTDWEVLLKLIGFLALQIGLACMVYKMARNKGRRAWAWFTVSVLLNPLLVMIVLAFMRARPGSLEEAKLIDARERRDAVVEKITTIVTCCVLYGPLIAAVLWKLV